MQGRVCARHGEAFPACGRPTHGRPAQSSSNSAAYAHFDKHKFGNEMLSMSGTLRDALQDAIEKEYTCALTAAVLCCAVLCTLDAFMTWFLLASWLFTMLDAWPVRRSRKAANVYESLVICERLETGCEDLLEAQHRMRLPSTGRFR